MSTAKLHIVIHAMGMPFNGRTVFEQSLGGSETAAYYQARELAKRGHQVDVWTSIEADSRDELGIRYTAAGPITQETPLGARFTDWATNTPHDVLIIQRHPLAFHNKWAADICIWQLHDLALHRTTGAVYHGLWQINAITTVSEWHKKQVLDIWGIKPDAIHVVPNGVDQELYGSVQPLRIIPCNGLPPGIYENEHGRVLRGEEKFLLLYQSRPERGLDHLVRPGGIMDRLRDTNAHLLVCGYANTVPQMVEKYAQWDAMARALPNVTMLGALTKPQLASLQKSCDLLCYPTEFEEVSCITAMEAMHAGLPMMTSAHAALPETCLGAGIYTIVLKDGKADEDQFVSMIRDACNGELSLTMSREAQLQAAKEKTWSHAVDKLEALIFSEYFRSVTPERLYHHAIEHSDLQLAKFAHGQMAFEPTIDKELALYDFTESPEEYAQLYADHQAEYYDQNEHQVIGEDVTQTSRFRGVASYLAMRQEAVGKNPDGSPRAMRVLDYGCAHGHYLMKFAQWLPASEFFGIDISERAIAAAMKWAMRDRITNVTLAWGGLEHADEWTAPLVEIIEDKLEGTSGGAVATQLIEDQRFDAIICGEVLEHVPDPFALAQRLLSLLKPGGVLIGSTPVGRWEWIKIESFRVTREHLWHFNRRDLDRMFEDYVHDIAYAKAGHDRAGGLIGSYVFSVTQHELSRVKALQVGDRLSAIAPRQTVSACLIVKDGEQTIRRCITSFIDWVDEILIGVDPGTKDRTELVIRQIQDDYPIKKIVVVHGKKATEEGFDAARNAVLEHARCDWILWLDADEEVRTPWNLWRFLKPSAIDGVGLPQIHYSSEPALVLTTDRPTRLFRRSSGAVFFGRVHEHPEVEPGKAIPHTVLRDEVQFLHSGYVDEETRRKRFDRNLPLLQRDLVDHPTRVLNKFLALRDASQGVIFSLERTGGRVLPSHLADARRAVAYFEELLGGNQHLRLLIDSLEFYSQMVAVLGEGFEAQFSIATTKPGAESLNVKTDVKGRFLNRSTYLKFITRLAEESTKHYESPHL
jgi:glycosyltransferase involved in cell wall biosynthesis/2-polyprenyl-3-methyl-5-hydroxy-6-metoxy-1,4-benzoquinol methylase